MVNTIPPLIPETTFVSVMTKDTHRIFDKAARRFYFNIFLSYQNNLFNRKHLRFYAPNQIFLYDNRIKIRLFKYRP